MLNLWPIRSGEQNRLVLPRPQEQRHQQGSQPMTQNVSFPKRNPFKQIVQTFSPTVLWETEALGTYVPILTRGLQNRDRQILRSVRCRVSFIHQLAPIDWHEPHEHVPPHHVAEGESSKAPSPEFRIQPPGGAAIPVGEHQALDSWSFNWQMPCSLLPCPFSLGVPFFFRLGHWLCHRERLHFHGKELEMHMSTGWI